MVTKMKKTVPDQPEQFLQKLSFPGFLDYGGISLTNPVIPPDAKSDVKLIILGDSAVGKSKLVDRFLLDDYEERTMSTHALTIYRKFFEVDGETLLIDLWDTAGQETFNEIHPSYYFGANACILVFDATRKITYEHLTKWYAEMRVHCPDIPCILVANKIDIDERVTKRTYSFSTKSSLPLYFVSAASGVNVVKIFKEAIKLGVSYKKAPPDPYFKDLMDVLNNDELFADEPPKKA